MFRNAGLVFRSVVLSLALASVFACTAEDTGKEEQGTSGSDLSKGKHAKGDASANDSDASANDSDASADNDASVTYYPDDASVNDDASYDDSDGGTKVNDAAARW